MTDVRELILARLTVTGATVAGVVTCLRNASSIADTQCPAVVIYDADEIADQNDTPSRPVNAPRRVGMQPEILIKVAGVPEAVGAEMNAIRAALVKAILSDATLIAMTADARGIRYDGCATRLALGRSMEGEMGVSFTFNYYLKPDDL